MVLSGVVKGRIVFFCTRPCRIASVYCETAYLGLLSEDGPYLG